MLIHFHISCRRMLAALVILHGVLLSSSAPGQTNFFELGIAAYKAGNFGEAAKQFEAETRRAPSAESWSNLGNAEWQSQQHGPAVLAWERALWINPFDKDAAAGLWFARQSSGLSAPPLRWWEVFSTCLPPNVWAGLAAASFWVAVSAGVIFPVTLRWRRTAWSQSLAAFGLGIFLLALTGAYGVQTRARLAVVTAPAATMLQAPTAHAPVVSKLNAGEVARTEFARGNYLYVRTGTGEVGWLERSQLHRIASQ